MVHWMALSCIILPSSLSSQPYSKVHVSPSTNTFIDHEGYTRIFHGGSQVNKVASSDHGLLYYTHSQLQQFQEWGFKMIRLGFLWDAYEPSPGVFNEEYMDGIENLTKVFWDYGMMTMLDMHQDLWSPLFCGGHGIPAFYSYPDNSTDEFWKYHNATYPLPHFEPHGYSETDDAFADVFGKVDDTTCRWLSQNTSIGWAAGYTTYAMSNAVQRFYDDEDLYLTKFALHFWLRVAQRFQDKPWILGYELINEPWVGDVFKFPELYTPKACDAINLRRTYKYLHDVIRSVDNDTIIFYEPCTGGNDLDGFPVGFATGPGGNAYDSKQALSYHIYCPFIQTDVPLNTSLIELCYKLNGLQWRYRLEDTVKLHTAGFLTEFGAIPQDEAGYELIDFMMDRSDEHLVSWAYWYITPSEDASDVSEVAMHLSRTYAYKIASDHVHRMLFNQSSKAFVLQYEMYAAPKGEGMSSEIFYSPKLHYPNGVEYAVEPDDLVDVTVHSVYSLITLAHGPGADGQMVTFKMCPQQSADCDLQSI